MIKLTDLQVVSENANEIWAYCPRHLDKHRPNFWVTKHNGLGHCFACGYTGEVKGDFKVTTIKNKPNNINWWRLCDLYRSQLTVGLERALKNKWNVGWEAVWKMAAGWTGEAWSFPVKDAALQIVGIQRIFPDNSKRMINGSRVGILAPNGTNWKSDIWITEGVSDTAVALDLGLNVVGRLSCTCGNHILKKIIHGIDVTIVADADEIGIKSAKKLKNDLAKQNKKVILYIAEVGNDLRDWRNIWGKPKLKQYIKSIT